MSYRISGMVIYGMCPDKKSVLIIINKKRVIKTLFFYANPEAPKTPRSTFLPLKKFPVLVASSAELPELL